jgi:hypothetical protein
LAIHFVFALSGWTQDEGSFVRLAGLTSVIAPKGSRAYVDAMGVAIFRLLALIAIALMPLGMAGPAMAQPISADHSALAMQMGHCNEQPTKEKTPAPSKMDCTAMCTALPAADSLLPAETIRPLALLTAAIAAPFTGIEPEIATPPPRQG